MFDTSGWAFIHKALHGGSGATHRRRDAFESNLRDFENKSYKTYRSKLAASQRLAWRGAAWNGALVTASFATTIASLTLLADSEAYGARGEVVLIAAAFLSLTTSLIVSDLKYGLRQRAMEADYKAVQVLSTRAEASRKMMTAESLGVTEIEQMRRELAVAELDYERIILNGENHATVDFIRGFDSQRKYVGWRKLLVVIQEAVLSALPLVVAGGALALCVPLVSWSLGL